MAGNSNGMTMAGNGNGVGVAGGSDLVGMVGYGHLMGMVRERDSVLMTVHPAESVTMSFRFLCVGYNPVDVNSAVPGIGDNSASAFRCVNAAAAVVAGRCSSASPGAGPSLAVGSRRTSRLT